MLDFRSLDNNSTFETDLCIIGAGAAGITIARDFAKDKRRVLLIESGGVDYEDETQDLYRGLQLVKKRARSIEGGVHYGVTLHDARLRYFGGTTNHWGGWATPLTHMDFEKRDWVPHSGWPIKFDDLAPYYLRAQETCEIGKGPFDKTLWEGQKETPFPFNEEKLTPRFYRFSPPTRFGERYAKELEEAEQIKVLLNANVTELKLNSSASAIESVEIKSLNGKKGTVSAKQYVLACGGTENPRILLLSNSIVGAGVGNQYDLVGRFFMDHLMDSAGYIMVTEKPSRLEYLFDQFTPHNDEIDVQASLVASETLQREKRILNIGVVLDGEWKKPSPGIDSLYRIMENNPQEDGEKVFNENLWTVLANIDEALPAAIRRLRGKRPKHLPRFVGGCEQAPNPVSRVKLSSQKDSLGQNRILLDWRLTELDRRTFVEMGKSLAAEFGRLGIGRVQAPEWFDEDSSDFFGDDFSRRLEAARHHSGTTRMSNDPKTGVVDKNCKVHGIGNLYVAGSSVFPTIGQAGPTFTIVALAHRLADHLKKKFS